MFTGIIQSMARIVSIFKDKKENFRTHVVELSDCMLNGLDIGNSVSHNGCCLSVTKIHGNYVSFNLIEETLRITNLNEMKPGDIVNIERAAKFNDEIGGHLMSGHIMTSAEVTKILISGNSHQIWFKLSDPSFMKYIFHKGFIGIDGVSLTVGAVTTTHFCIYLIPETLQKTTLGKIKKLKHRVNVEIDPSTQAIVDTTERILTSKNYC